MGQDQHGSPTAGARRHNRIQDQRRTDSITLRRQERARTGGGYASGTRCTHQLKDEGKEIVMLLEVYVNFFHVDFGT